MMSVNAAALLNGSDPIQVRLMQYAQYGFGYVNRCGRIWTRHVSDDRFEYFRFAKGYLASERFSN